MVEIRSKAASNTHDSPCFSYLLGSYSHYLSVYKDVQLVWTAKTASAAPVWVSVLRVGAIEGLVFTLSDGGLLTVAYLGTEAPQGGVQHSGGDAKDSNYEQMSIEH